jgi:carbon monoxide dehydrogenase subunit G
MRIEQTFTVARPPEAVFDFVTDPAKLSKWQTTKTEVEVLNGGPPRQGMRIRERTDPPLGKAFDMITEFAEFDRPRRLAVRVVEGPYPIDGWWTFEPDGDGTRVHFFAEGEQKGMMKLLGPLLPRVLSRQFAGYHEELRKHLEGV